MRRPVSNRVIILLLTTTVALAACGERQRCVQDRMVGGRMQPVQVDEKYCEDQKRSGGHGTTFINTGNRGYAPHSYWYYGGDSVRSSTGVRTVSGGSTTPSSSRVGSGGKGFGSSHHSFSFGG